MKNSPALVGTAPGIDTHLDDASFRALASIVKSTSGITMADNKKSMLVSRLSKRLRALGIASFPEYCQLIETERGAEERQKLIFLLTTNVTRFFREKHHFEDLKQRILPGLLERARQGGRVRIWSAGCSSGEEPYSIAITVLESCPDAVNLDLRILATDLDGTMIERANIGQYHLLGDGDMPAQLKKRFLLPISGQENSVVQVAQDARRLVTFSELNLMEEWPMKGKFDLIFCRNVVIYFDEDTQNRLWARFSDFLVPGGHLFIGHSERVPVSRFKEFVPAGVTLYRRE